MSDMASVNHYPLKDVATIRWLENMTEDLASAIEQLNPSTQNSIRDLGYDDLQAAQNFMEALNLVLLHPDPISLRNLISQEIHQIEQRHDQRQDDTVRSQGTLGSFFSKFRGFSDQSYSPQTRLIEEYRLPELKLALDFIDDGLFILQASTLESGRDHLWDVFPRWYQHTGRLLLVSIELQRSN